MNKQSGKRRGGRLGWSMSNSSSEKDNDSKLAFTLIELIIVMSILAVLMLLATPKLLGYTEKARFTRDIHLAKTLETGLEDFMVHGGILKDHLDIINREEIQKSADKNMLLNPKGFVEVVEDGVYYELTYDFIKNHLNIKVAKNEKINDFLIEALAAQYPVAAYAEQGGKALVDRTRGLRGHAVEAEPEYTAPEVCPTPESLNFEFDHLTGTIIKYTGAEVHLNIPPFLLVDEKCYRVRIIGKEAFMGKGILTIQLPPTIITIEDGAFSGNNLTDIIIPEGTKFIGDNAFKNNFLGTDMKPNNGSITEAGTFPSGHSGVILPDNSLESIGIGAFENNKLESVVIPDSVKNIGDNAFKGNNVSIINMPSNTIIGENIFAGNEATTVTIPAGVKTIPANTFKGSGIISVIFPEGLERIEDYAFAYNQIVEVNLPSSLVYVGNYAFAYNQIGTTRATTTITFKGNEYIGTLNSDGDISSEGMSVTNIDSLTLKSSIFKITTTANPGNISTISKIVSAGPSTFLLQSNGKILGVGLNAVGQLGDGTNANRTTITYTSGINNAVDVSGDGHSHAVLADGTAWSWGFGYEAGLGSGRMVNALTPVQMTNVINAKSVSAGTYSTFVVLKDGTVKSFGKYALGHKYSTFNEYIIEPRLINGLTNVNYIESGNSSSIALLNDGTLMGWGNNSRGQLALGNNAPTSIEEPVAIPGIENVKKISYKQDFALALLNDGTVYAWGYNTHGNLGLGDKIDRKVPTQIQGLDKVKDIAAGEFHSLILLEDGTVASVGPNTSGQLGLPNVPSTIASATVTFQTIPGLINIKEVVAGKNVSFAIDFDGNVWSWGENAYGQLGLGNTNDQFAPVLSPFFKMD